MGNRLHIGAVRSVGQLVHARGSEARAAQVSATARLTGACRHGQMVLKGGGVLQTRGNTGAHEWDGYGEDDGNRAEGHVLRIADRAKRTVQVWVTGTARRWRGGRVSMY